MGQQVVGGAVAVPAHIVEGKGALLALVVAPHHGAAARLVVRDVVHAVVGEVEVFRHHRPEGAEDAVFVKFLLTVALVEEVHPLLLHGLFPLLLFAL